KYIPRKEVIIHEYTKYNSSDDLINALTKGAPAGSILNILKWVDGVLLSFRPLPMKEVIIKALLEGTLYWDHVSFAPMPKYQDQIITQNGVTVVINDVSGNPVFVAISEFIKKEFLKT
ncbi:hypothetical protein KAS24_05605, partial [Candidatus Bathyarchaeota archaeon]|nr:hypothetical protein [Candidatus Bathyarchaeota archaeon]